MPRHRHTFDQMRLRLVRDMNLGDLGILREGEVGNFADRRRTGRARNRIGLPDADSGSRIHARQNKGHDRRG